MSTVDRRTAALALLADLVSVVVFCTIGRRSHAEGLTVAGIAETAWPFLAGTEPAYRRCGELVEAPSTVIRTRGNDG